MQIVIVVAETIVGSLWSVVNLKQDLLLFCIFYSLFFKTAHANGIDRCVTEEVVTWCLLYKFFFLLILAQHCLFFPLFNRELKQGHSTHVNRKRDLYLFVICRETHISSTNSLNRTLCPKIWASYCSAEYCPKM